MLDGISLKEMYTLLTITEDSSHLDPTKSTYPLTAIKLSLSSNLSLVGGSNFTIIKFGS